MSTQVPAPSAQELTDRERGRRHGGQSTKFTPERRGLADRRAENNRLHVSFRLGELTFVLGIEQVREVLKAPDMTLIPLASQLLAGLINLRGEIVPAVDLRFLLDGVKRSEGEDMLVVVRAAEGAFALVVDEVHDILEISPTMLLDAPANLPSYLKPLTAAVCKMPDALLLSLDVAGVARAVETHPRHKEEV
jgi:purine-binding chemotaxis protein CheW